MPPTRSLDRLLVVAEPWASLLVDGDKTWELRTTSTKVRGPIGIASKGTGTIVGKVDLVDVHGPFTPDEISEYRHLHRVPDGDTATYGGSKGLFAWEVTGAVRFDAPVPYRHPQGAVIWVRLDPPVEITKGPPVAAHIPTIRSIRAPATPVPNTSTGPPRSTPSRPI